MRRQDAQRLLMESPVGGADAAGTMQWQRHVVAVGGFPTSFGYKKLPGSIVPRMQFVLKEQSILTAS